MPRRPRAKPSTAQPEPMKYLVDTPDTLSNLALPKHAPLLERYPRAEGEPDPAYRAFLLWARQPARTRRWIVVCDDLGKGKGYCTQLRRWAAQWGWEARLAGEVVEELEIEAAVVTSRVKAHREDNTLPPPAPRKVPKPKAPEGPEPARDKIDRALRYASRASAEAERTLTHVERYQKETRQLYLIQLTMARALLSKLLPAVSNLKADKLTPRELAALVTASTRAIDSAIASLSEEAGITAYLEQVERELSASPAPTDDRLPPSDDGELEA